MAGAALPARQAEEVQDPVPALKEAAEPGEQARRDHAAGWEAFQEGDLVLAEELFQRAIAGGMPLAWRGIAEIRRREGDAEGAVLAFEELVRALPDDLRARADYAGVLAAIPERRARAIETYRAVLDQDPEDRDTRLALAEVLSWDGEHREAEKRFRRLLEDETDPLRRSREQLGLANCWSWSGQRLWAAGLYRELLDGSQSHAARRGLADLELWQGREGAAALAYQDVLLEDPDDFVALQGKADALEAQRPRLFLNAQSYSDSADWKRVKILGGVDFQIAPDSAPDLRLRAGIEQARFEDAAGETAERRSLVTRLDWAIDPFTVVHAGLEASEAGDSGLRGGLGLEYQPENSSSFWIDYRHDDWIDPSGPFRFDRYNSPYTSRVQTAEGLQDDSFRIGAFHQMANGWGFLGNAEGGVVQDGNSHSDTYLQIHHRFDPQQGLALQPRVFHYRKDFALPSNLYFSPSGLESWGGGLRMDAWNSDFSREAYLDLSAFFQPSGISSWGYSFEASVVQRWSGGEAGLLANHLSTDERGTAARFYSTAVQAFVAVVF